MALKGKHPSLIILSTLLAGQPVVVGGEEWRLEDGVFGIVRGVWKDDKWTEDVVLAVDMTVSSFVKWCEKLPEETLIQAAFSTVVVQGRRPRG